MHAAKSSYHATPRKVSKIPWLFNEDAALKHKLEGLMVTDATDPNGREVKVRYRLPETEIADLDFPIIIITHNSFSLANEREHRGIIKLPYAPEGSPTWWGDTDNPAVDQFDPNDSPYFSSFPLPYNFDYRIDVYCRFVRDHTLPLIAQLAQYNRLDPKFGFLDIPQDGTKRTMQLLGGPSVSEGKDENDKRFFVATYLVRVFSELVPQVLQYALTQQVNIDLSVYADTTNLTGQALAESTGILSVGANSAWNVSTQ